MANRKRTTAKVAIKKIVVPVIKTEEVKQNALLNDIEQTFNKCLLIAKMKNSDYAGKETLDPFKNFRGSEFVSVKPERAILVRTMDKISRVSNLLDFDAEVKDESINDTIDDIINYMAILKSFIKNNKYDTIKGIK